MAVGGVDGPTTVVATLLVCAALVASAAGGATAADVASPERPGVAVDVGAQPGGDVAGDSMDSADSDTAGAADGSDADAASGADGAGADSADAASGPDAAQMAAGERIASCGVVDEPGRYTLSDDLRSTDGDVCLRVQASNVTIDGNGHTIVGNGSEGSIGVLVLNGTLENGAGDASVRNVTVRNVTVSGWGTGVQAGWFSSSDTEVRLVDVRLTGNTAAGVRLHETDDSVLRDVTVRGNGDGVVLWETYGLTATNVTIADNDEIGLYLAQNVGDSVFRGIRVTGNAANCSDCAAVSFDTDAVNNTVTDSRIVDNGGTGVRFSDSFDNTVRDTVIAGNGGPGVVGDNAGDGLVNVSLRGNAAPALALRAGSLSVDSVGVGDAYRVSAPGPVDTGFGGAPFALDAVAAEDLPGDPPGNPAAAEALNVTAPPAPLTVSAGLNGSVDPAAVDLWRYTGSEWVRVDGASVEGDRIVGTVNASGLVVPLAPADAADGTDGTAGGSDGRDTDGTDSTGDGATDDTADGDTSGGDAADDDTADDGSADDGSANDGSTAEPGDVPADESTLVIRSTADNQFEYAIVVEGTAEPTSTADVSADSGDRIVENDDGTATITGSTGSNAGDAFTITGEVLSAEVTGVEDGYRLVLDGEDVTDEAT